MGGAGTLVISGEWLQTIRAGLRAVESSGQAWAAIDAARSFASDVASEVRGGWLNFDPWRSTSANQVIDAANKLAALKRSYAAGSPTRVDATNWAADAEKIAYVYNLAQVVRQGYPADVDASGLDAVLADGANALVGAVLGAPGAVIAYAGDVVGKAVDTVVGVGKKAVKGAASIARDAAEGVSAVGESLIPWRAVLLGVGVLTLGVIGVVYLQKAGVGGTVVKVLGK